MFFVSLVVAAGAYPFAGDGAFAGFVAEAFALLWGVLGVFGPQSCGDVFERLHGLASGFVRVFHVGNEWTNGRASGYEATS